MSAYSLIILFLQTIWISRLSYPAMRADLLLPLMFGVATIWPPLASLSWAFVWGFAVDTLSGKFWGFHVGSYVVAVCLVNVTTERFELQNPLYQMLFVGLCALGQSIALGLFLLFQPYDLANELTLWQDLVIRSLFTMLLCPFIIYPIRDDKRATV
jgi:rod shape-determining protein MreD